MDILEGTFKNFVFRNDDNGFSIIRLQDSEEDSQTASGIFPYCNSGEDLRLEGQWIEHAKYGRQFKVQKVEIVPPKEKDGLVRYFSSGIFRGVGPATALRLVEHFGDNVLDILTENSTQIKELPNFSPKKAENFIKDWNEHLASRETLQFLHQFQVPARLAMRIFQKYKEDTIITLRENPYILCEDIHGIGFQKADEVARKIGFDSNSYFRLQAGLRYTLENASREGHIFLPARQLIEFASKTLYTPQSEELEERLIFSLDNLIEAKKVIAEEGLYYLPTLHTAEKGIADWVKHALVRKANKHVVDPDHEINAFAENKSLSYSEEQKAAMIDALKAPLFVLTGGPGTGKTTTLLGLLFLLRQSKKSVKLAAPTGRAARRMAEVCGREAFTLHRLLEYTPGESHFARDASNPLKCDVLVLDEASMVDAPLFWGLLQALPSQASLIVVGDQDQLPSVGPGNVLRELLAVPSVPQTRLKEIFRQIGENDIPFNAQRIQQGLLPEFRKQTQFHFRTYENMMEAQNKILTLVSKNLPEHFGFDPMHDIQVLTPMHRGVLGVEELNQVLQGVLNPHGKKVKLSGKEFRLGDKVMQLRNNYEKNIFNGDVGYITQIKEKSKELVIDFGDRIVLDFADADQLVLAYACTIHKSQGSEYKAAVIVLDPSHHIMLQRNLLYTGVTRAKERVFLIAKMDALEKAVQNNKIQKRFTQLSGRIDKGAEFMELLEAE